MADLPWANSECCTTGFSESSGPFEPPGGVSLSSNLHVLLLFAAPSQPDGKSNDKWARLCYEQDWCLLDRASWRWLKWFSGSDTAAVSQHWAMDGLSKPQTGKINCKVDQTVAGELVEASEQNTYWKHDVWKWNRGRLFVNNPDFSFTYRASAYVCDTASESLPPPRIKCWILNIRSLSLHVEIRASFLVSLLTGQTAFVSKSHVCKASRFKWRLMQQMMDVAL